MTSGKKMKKGDGGPPEKDDIYGPEYFSGKRSFFYRLTGGYRNIPRVFDHHASHVLRHVECGRLLDVGCAYGFLLERFEGD
ncbi:MAG: hypothetical protein QF662_06685, partial [Phycisphaerae bacterium]|nr:hypothetical protein [Phycisphaerae bacterium]